MIKEAIEKYFKKLDALCLKKRNIHPMMPYVESMPKWMYSGNRNSSNYIEWKLVKNNDLIDFEQIENRIHIKLHKDLKEYFGSYYFLKMEGEINGKKIEFTPITPLVDIATFLFERHKIAKQQQRDENKIDLGFAEVDGADSYLLLFNNDTGEVEILDPENKKDEVIAKSLYDLISNMLPRC